MSMFLQRPQNMDDIALDIGDEYNRPQNVHGVELGPAGDNELIEETALNFSNLLYDAGTNNGFVLIEET